MGFFSRAAQKIAQDVVAVPQPKIKHKKGPCTEEQLAGYIKAMFTEAEEAKKYIPTLTLGDVTEVVTKNNRGGEVIVELFDVSERGSIRIGNCRFIYLEDGTLDYISAEYDPYEEHSYSFVWSRGRLHRAAIVI